MFLSEVKLGEEYFWKVMRGGLGQVSHDSDFSPQHIQVSCAQALSKHTGLLITPSPGLTSLPWILALHGVFELPFSCLLHAQVSHAAVTASHTRDNPNPREAFQGKSRTPAAIPTSC